MTPLILGPAFTACQMPPPSYVPSAITVILHNPSEANTGELSLAAFESSLNRIGGVWRFLNKTELKRRTLSRKRFRHWRRQRWSGYAPYYKNRKQS